MATGFNFRKPILKRNIEKLGQNNAEVKQPDDSMRAHYDSNIHSFRPTEEKT